MPLYLKWNHGLSKAAFLDNQKARSDRTVPNPMGHSQLCIPLNQAIAMFVSFLMSVQARDKVAQRRIAPW